MLYGLKRRMYRTGRPNWVARVMNRMSAIYFSSGYLVPKGWITLEVRGRKTGQMISFPLVAVEVDGNRYVVSMLGNDAGWIKNLRAGDMRAVVQHRGAQHVQLEEVAPCHRAAILRPYLNAAPGARPHIPVDRRAPLAEFERIATEYPVFRLVPDPAEHGGRTLPDRCHRPPG